MDLAHTIVMASKAAFKIRPGSELSPTLLPLIGLLSHKIEIYIFCSVNNWVKEQNRAACVNTALLTEVLLSHGLRRHRERCHGNMVCDSPQGTCHERP